MNIKGIFDCHCDTIEKAFDENSSLNNINYAFNLKDVSNHLPYIQCIASFVSSKYDDGKTGGIDRVNSIIDKLYMEYELNKDKMYVIKSKDDFNEEISHKKVGCILTVENGTAISGNIENIHKLYNRGIRMMSLTWNEQNDLASGCKVNVDTGLTMLGNKCIKYMNKLQMLIDVSHCSKKTFYDILDINSLPVIASHSCCNSICINDRNLDDDQIKHIAKIGGVIGVCFYSKFLSSNKLTSCDDIVNHIEYIADLVGVEYVGLGTDFEGVEKDDLPIDIKGVNDIDILINKLIDRGFSNNEINKILSENFIRVFGKYI